MGYGIMYHYYGILALVALGAAGTGGVAMRQQSFQKALSKMTENRLPPFLCGQPAVCRAHGLLQPLAVPGRVVLVLILYLYFQTGITRRKKEEVMVYLDHMTSGWMPPPRRTMITSPLPIVIFRPDTDDIIWSNELPPPDRGPGPSFETKLSALVPSFQSQWLLDGDHLAPEPIPVGEKQYLVYGNLGCTGDEDAFLATTYWSGCDGVCLHRRPVPPPARWWAFYRWITTRT